MMNLRLYRMWRIFFFLKSSLYLIPLLYFYFGDKKRKDYSSYVVKMILEDLWTKEIHRILFGEVSNYVDIIKSSVAGIMCKYKCNIHFETTNSKYSKLPSKGRQPTVQNDLHCIVCCIYNTTKSLLNLMLGRSL